MVIHSLNLFDFRNYEKFNTEFNSGVNFIYGRNGQGKTNLIESLYLITHLKSFRTSKISDLNYFSKKISIVQTNLSKQDVRHEIKITLHENLKKVLHNQKVVNYSSEYIKNFLSLLFSPDQLVAFKESPLERRNYIDRILYLKDNKYFQRVKEYNRIKKQKNALLRDGSKEEIHIWNRLLSSVIPEIVSARKKITNQINSKISSIFNELTGRNTSLMFWYGNDFKNRSEPDSESIFGYLMEKMEQEIAHGFCLFGPHKDNFWMTLNGKKDRQIFSQGEYRIAYLSLLLAINTIVSNNLKFKPVLLLDDIFSELDEIVSERILKYIIGKENQVFITSTELCDQFSEIGVYIENGRLAAK